MSHFATVLVERHSPQAVNADTVSLTLSTLIETQRAKLPEQLGAPSARFVIITGAVGCCALANLVFI